MLYRFDNNPSFPINAQLMSLGQNVLYGIEYAGIYLSHVSNDDFSNAISSESTNYIYRITTANI